jgi:hypothetical protein
MLHQMMVCHAGGWLDHRSSSGCWPRSSTSEGIDVACVYYFQADSGAVALAPAPMATPLLLTGLIATGEAVISNLFANHRTSGNACYVGVRSCPVMDR